MTIWLSIFSFAVLALGLLRWRRDRRVDRHFWIAAAFAVLNFGLYIFLGAMLMLLLWQPNVPRWHGLLLAGFMIGWLLYGLLWLTRTGPRFGEPSAWIGRRWLDGVLVGLTAMFGLTALLV